MVTVKRNFKLSVPLNEEVKVHMSNAERVQLANDLSEALVGLGWSRVDEAVIDRLQDLMQALENA